MFFQTKIGDTDDDHFISSHNVYFKVLLGSLEGNMEVLEVPVGSGLTPLRLVWDTLYRDIKLARLCVLLPIKPYLSHSAVAKLPRLDPKYPLAYR